MKSHFLLLVLVSSYSTKAANDKCEDFSKHISFHNPTVFYAPPSPIGSWTSSSCEVIPGPRYILRKWNIQESVFYGTIFHYSDSWCTQPLFSVQVSGPYKIHAATATPQAKTSQACEFKFEKIFYKTDNVTTLQETLELIKQKCIDAIPVLTMVKESDSENITWDLFINKNIKIENAAITKKHCRYYFGLHSSSYKKIRMIGLKKGFSNENDVLYFSDIPPKHHEKSKDYIGYGFQYGLFRVHRPNCPVCEVINISEEQPVLPPYDHSQDFIGGWVSSVCEAVNDNTFQTRYFEFYPPNGDNFGDVSLQINFYLDQNCKEKRLSIKARGKVDEISPHESVDGILKLSLILKSMLLTGYNGPTLGIMRQPDNRCGDSEKWKYGFEQDVTQTNGCKMLGLIVPKSSDMFIRVVSRQGKKELYIQDNDEKGTFFTDYLIPCNIASANISKMTTSELPTPRINLIPEAPDFDIMDQDLDSPSSNASSHRCSLVLLVLLKMLMQFFD
ncbi:protein APCDD1-like [Hydra vulgaris]|uniref:Protein APCDD1-like n=1 Tax=Hydra vulgaris TaxID=6087 RepID=A0ABM4DP00_HYDVU